MPTLYNGPMFSGIVQEIGIVKNIKSSKGILNIEITSSELIKDLKEGDSIAVDGCCQTVIELRTGETANRRDGDFSSEIKFAPSPLRPTADSFFIQATEETLSKTNFKNLKIGSRVNLESALKLGDKINGHLVTGHIDMAGEISDVLSSYDNKIVKINFPSELKNHIAPKGSICVNGVSLTVVGVGLKPTCTNNEFSFTLIPYTRDNTNLGLIKIGDLVNLEIDLISRYLVNYLENTKTLVLK